MRPIRESVLRADREGGELADWVNLVDRVLGTESHRVVLMGGRAARLLAWLCAAEAVTLGNRVLLSSTGWVEISRRSRAGLLLLAHEIAHLAQYRRHGWLRFLLRYGGEYLAGRLGGASHRQAYLAISFEREARLVETIAARLLTLRVLLRSRPI